jgi:hypothetical protein
VFWVSCLLGAHREGLRGMEKMGFVKASAGDKKTLKMGASWVVN